MAISRLPCHFILKWAIAVASSARQTRPWCKVVWKSQPHFQNSRKHDMRKNLRQTPQKRSLKVYLFSLHLVSFAGIQMEMNEPLLFEEATSSSFLEHFGKLTTPSLFDPATLKWQCYPHNGTSHNWSRAISIVRIKIIIIILFLWKFYCTQILFPIDLHDFRYNSFISNNPTEGIILFFWIIFILTIDME